MYRLEIDFVPISGYDDNFSLLCQALPVYLSSSIVLYHMLEGESTCKSTLKLKLNITGYSDENNKMRMTSCVS